MKLIKDYNELVRDLFFKLLWPCQFLTALFILLRACGVLPWPWVWVLSPSWLLFLIAPIGTLLIIVVLFLFGVLGGIVAAFQYARDLRRRRRERS